MGVSAMKERRPGGERDAAGAAVAAAPAAAAGKRSRAGSLDARPAGSEQAGFYPMPPAADDAAALRALLARYAELERRVRAGDGDAAHALREVRARILTLAEDIRALDPEHDVLAELPPEVVADAGVGATVEDLVRAGRDDVGGVAGVGPMVCEDDDAVARGATCWLDPIERTRVVALLADRAETNANRWLAAVEHGVTDELLNDRTAWGMVTEILFNIATFGATSGIARAAAALSRLRLPDRVQRALVTASEPKNISAAVATVGKGVREKLKAAVATKPRVSKIEVLMSLRDAPGSWKDEVHVAALTALDDADLLAVTAALQPDRPELSSDAYDARVRDLVTRFDRNVLAVGTLSRNDHSLTVAARIRGPRGARMALMRYDEQHVQRTGWEAETAGDDRLHFVEWIETEFAPIAAERQRAIFHAEVDLRPGDPMLANPEHPALAAWLIDP